MAGVCFVGDGADVGNRVILEEEEGAEKEQGGDEDPGPARHV